MRRNKVKKENPPARLLGTMILLVLGLVAVYVGMALGIFTLVQRLVHLEDASYTLLWPILILSVSAILGILLAIFIFRGYLAPLSRLMKATKAVAAGDYSVRVELRGARGEVAAYIHSFNKMAEELASVELLRSDFVNTFSHEFKTPLISIRGFAKLLQSPDLTPEQRQTYTDTIVQQSERLAAMSTNILELTQYENTEIVSGKTLYSLDEQLRRCVRQQERDWLKKGLTVEGDLDRVDYYGNEELLETDDDFPAFVEAIRYINRAFVRAIASDGEGATKMFQVDVSGMPDKDTARHLAKAIVASNLVKCAMYGADANWGRIVCAMGQSGVKFDPYRVDIEIASVAGHLEIVKHGVTTDYDEKEASHILSEKQIKLKAHMNMGDEMATAWGCDLTYDYIKINADYRK